MDSPIDFQRLLKLRKLTRAVSEHFSKQLRSYLRILTPLLDPRRTFGTYIHRDSKLSPPNAEKQFSELAKVYESLRGQGPCERLEKLSTPMDILAAPAEIKTAQYSYVAEQENEQKTITVISPLKWIVSYQGIDADRLQKLISGHTITPGSELKKYILHHLVMQSILAKKPGVCTILEAMRYPVKPSHSSEFEKLPIVYITCPISTIRPPDNLIIQGTELSGTSTFEEVINFDDISQMSDPFKDQLVSFVKKQDESLFSEISDKE